MIDFKKKKNYDIKLKNIQNIWYNSNYSCDIEYEYTGLEHTYANGAKEYRKNNILNGLINFANIAWEDVLFTEKGTFWNISKFTKQTDPMVAHL